MLVTLALFAAAFARDWGLPGLYMDAINPEYDIPGILHPPPPVEYQLPGNKVLGDRFPVFTGTYYHGSVQLYAVLPFMKVFGAKLGTFRVFQLLVGAGIIVLALWMAASDAFGPKRALAAGAAGVLALDPAFVLALRTQAYSTVFPLLLLLGCILLLRGGPDVTRPRLRLLVAGVLYGLAVFGYFIFAFFLPALLWLLVHPPGTARRRPWSSTLPWLAGCVVGYLPFLLGMLLLERNLGGLSQLVDFLRDSRDELHVGVDHAGPFGRIGTVAGDSFRVLTGEWPRLLVVGGEGAGVLESAKAYVLLLVPLLAVAVPSLSTRDERRATAVPVALVVSFGIGALVFGARLDGHHYAAALPLLYVAFGCACASLWRGGARAGLVVAAIAVVAVASVVEEQDFHDGLEATGGAGLYSNAIDRFAERVDGQGVSLYTPDWGFAMPFAFLTDASPIHTRVDVADLRQRSCGGQRQAVVFRGPGNEQKLRLVAGIARRPMGPIRTWSQRDGVPVFQVAWFPPVTRCRRTVPRRRPGPANRAVIDVTPRTLPECEFLQNVVAGVSWSIPGRRSRDVDVVVQTPGSGEAVAAHGGRSGSIDNGPVVLPGTIIRLRDAVTRRELASATVRAAPCPGPSSPPS